MDEYICEVEVFSPSNSEKFMKPSKKWILVHKNYKKFWNLKNL